MSETGKRPRSSRKELFTFAGEQAEFDSEVTKALQQLMREAQEQFISERNSLHYSHGRRWLLSSGQIPEERGFTEHSDIVEIRFSDIVSHDLSLIPRYLESAVRGLQQSFMKSLYETMDEACEQSGNVVNAKEVGSPAKAFLEMLKKIEFGVDREGRPQRPMMNVGSKAFEALKKDLEAQNEEFRREVQKIIVEKEERAIQREKRRRSRFRRINAQ